MLHNDNNIEIIFYNTVLHVRRWACARVRICACACAYGCVCARACVRACAYICMYDYYIILLCMRNVCIRVCVGECVRVCRAYLRVCEHIIICTCVRAHARTGLHACESTYVYA